MDHRVHTLGRGTHPSAEVQLEEWQGLGGEEVRLPADEARPLPLVEALRLGVRPPPQHAPSALPRRVQDAPPQRTAEAPPKEIAAHKEVAELVLALVREERIESDDLAAAEELLQCRSIARPVP